MHVIITGGSSGIGLAIARIATIEGHAVSIIARDAQRIADALRLLNGNRPGKAQAVRGDVSDAASIEAAIKTCLETFGECDLLITSAGIVEPAFFHELSPEQFRQQMEINFFGTVNAVRAIYPAMRARGEGRIMMISSGAALIGIPGYTAYCASKAALASFAESLRSEAGSDVYIGISFPPDTQTPQFEQELPKRPMAARAIMGRHKPWPVDKVAQRVWSAVKRKRPQVHFCWQIKALSLFGAFIKPFVYKGLNG